MVQSLLDRAGAFEADLVKLRRHFHAHPELAFHEVETAAEWYCHLKTTAARVPALLARLRELHPYETPEIVALPVAFWVVFPPGAGRVRMTGRVGGGLRRGGTMEGLGTRASLPLLSPDGRRTAATRRHPTRSTP